MTEQTYLNRNDAPDPMSVAQTGRPLIVDEDQPKSPQVYWLYGLIALALVILGLLIAS